MLFKRWLWQPSFSWKKRCQTIPCLHAGSTECVCVCVPHLKANPWAGQRGGGLTGDSGGQKAGQERTCWQHSLSSREILSLLSLSPKTLESSSPPSLRPSGPLQETSRALSCACIPSYMHTHTHMHTYWPHPHTSYTRSCLSLPPGRLPPSRVSVHCVLFPSQLAARQGQGGSPLPALVTRQWGGQADWLAYAGFDLHMPLWCSPSLSPAQCPSVVAEITQFTSAVSVKRGQLSIKTSFFKSWWWGVIGSCFWSCNAFFWF